MKTSRGNAALIGIVFLFLIGMNFVQAHRHPAPLNPLFIAVQIGLLSCYLCWIGIGELRKHSRFRLIKSIQLAGFISMIGIIVSPSAGSRLACIALVAMIMLTAFAVAMWYKFINDRTS